MERPPPPPQQQQQQNNTITNNKDTTITTDNKNTTNNDAFPMERVQRKFANWLRLREEQGMRFNVSLFQKQSFHNPNISETLMGWVGVDPRGSNFSTTTNPMIEALTDSSNTYERVKERIDSFDYTSVGEMQRREWERKFPATTTTTTATRAQPPHFVPSAGLSRQGPRPTAATSWGRQHLKR